MNKDVQARAEEDCPGEVEEANHDRRQLLVLLSAAAGICTMQLPTASAVDATETAPPRRALTGRDASGRSVFQSFDVTPQVVTFSRFLGSHSMNFTLRMTCLV